MSKIQDNTEDVAYVERAGWEYDGRGWRDPLSKAKPHVDEFMVKRRGGEDRTIRQVVLPPVAWSYTLDQALFMQRQRDRLAS